MALPDWINGHMTTPAAPAPTPNPTAEKPPAERAHSFSTAQAVVLVVFLLLTARLGYELSGYGVPALTITIAVAFGVVSSVYAARTIERRVKYTYNCPTPACKFSITATTNAAGLRGLQDIAARHAQTCKVAPR
ncbi:hypothetical protein ACIBCO_37330 [Streptomyces violascens]|uniref:hypothetical protein n=1 Tax=Streptomyces violascens TaxID=67381 RepID=UPI0037AA5416